MIKYDLFRALDPDKDYPISPFPMKIFDVRYDLPLPTSVGSALAGMLSDKGPFRPLDRYCDPGSFATLRTNPPDFGPNSGYPNYAESEIRYETADGFWVMVSVLHQAAGNQIAAAEIVRFAIAGRFEPKAAKLDPLSGELIMRPRANRFEPEVGDWIMQNGIYFQHGGGFEIARVTFYFNADFENEDDIFLEGARNHAKLKATAEQPMRFRMFCEMLERSSAGHQLARKLFPGSRYI